MLELHCAHGYLQPGRPPLRTTHGRDAVRREGPLEVGSGRDAQNDPGDRTAAALLLGIGRTTLYRKLKEYGVEV